jgi:hypothetical protein
MDAAERRPFWKRRIPWPVFVVVIALGLWALYVLVISPNRAPPCTLSTPCHVSEQKCSKLYPGHIWDGHTCAVNLRNPTAVYTGD